MKNISVLLQGLVVDESVMNQIIFRLTSCFGENFSCFPLSSYKNGEISILFRQKSSRKFVIEVFSEVGADQFNKFLKKPFVQYDFFSALSRVAK